MERYIPCEAGNGLFEEYSVIVTDFYGEKHEAIVSKGCVKIEREPKGKELVKGLLKVFEVEPSGDNVLIGLPGEAFNYSRIVVSPKVLKGIDDIK